MTPEERDRLAKAETRLDQSQREIEMLRIWVEKRFLTIDEKLDTIITTLNMSKGAWRTVVVMGSFGAAITSGLFGVITYLWSNVR
jgi:hypothetical protein